MIIWNPWHGCHKVSEGCAHCYMYFLDGKRGIDTSKVFRTDNFGLPLQRKRDGSFRIASGMQLYVGLSTDFFVEEADQCRSILRRQHLACIAAKVTPWSKCRHDNASLHGTSGLLLSSGGAASSHGSGGFHEPDGRSDGHCCCVPGVREGEKDADVHQVEPHKRRITADTVDTEYYWNYSIALGIFAY